MNNAISIYNLEKIVYQNQFYFIDIRESYQYDQLHIYNFENIPYDIPVSYTHLDVYKRQFLVKR